MRIAQLAPLAESVPPKLYGGTERVIAWLVDELVELGHDVTLFASGDSRTNGTLHPVWLAQGGSGTDQILALYATGGRHLPATCRSYQAALAHRARLSGTQAGSGSRALRRARLARLPSSRHAVHRSLRIPDRRAGHDSPLRTSFRHAVPGTYPTIIDPEDPPSRPERHIPNSIATMRVRLIAALVKTLPRCPCCGAIAAANARRRS
jgi:hypothetical protein